MSNFEKIGPTAYATGYMWYRLGLSHEALATPRGKRIDRFFRFLLGALRPVAGSQFDDLMVGRHLGIDSVLTRALDAGRVKQVLEIAAGLSGRGVRMSQRYGEGIRYVESDLPAMAATKRRLLENAGLLSAKHDVIELDALAESGARSLASAVATLDPNLGTAIITEGLMNYLDPSVARALWARVAFHLQRFPHGLYLSDAYLRSENDHFYAKIVRQMLANFVRGRLHVHFEAVSDGLAVMRAAGFQQVTLHDLASLKETRTIAQRPGGRRVRILEASLSSAS